MEGGYLHYDPTQDDEVEIDVLQLWPASDLLPCPECETMLRSHEEFIEHLEEVHWGIQKPKTHREESTKNSEDAHRSAGGPSTELKLAPPGATSASPPPSLSLTVESEKHALGFAKKQPKQLRFDENEVDVNGGNCDLMLKL
ncbi:hypothetical protein Acr_13g0009530 [Actinidia rufa]|uniref:C2H2-type domain-containing protein n=1 Tax=Actinidia rufa TaxID=165716 RepID=A0A7J0FLW0_9ERIC|nr:hypothetical protein Acr_13g0009530 [Actinidia rufa]